MRRRAVTLHRAAEQAEPDEHRVQRIERARARGDQDLGALGEQRLERRRHRGRVRSGIPDRQEP